MGGKRPPLSGSALRLLLSVAAHPGRSAADIAAEHGSASWRLLATVRGRYFVRWDAGGERVRVTDAGRRYLRGRGAVGGSR